jgi:hypothetical protein
MSGNMGSDGRPESLNALLALPCSLLPRCALPPEPVSCLKAREVTREGGGRALEARRLYEKRSKGGHLRDRPLAPARWQVYMRSTRTTKA